MNLLSKRLAKHFMRKPSFVTQKGFEYLHTNGYLPWFSGSSINMCDSGPNGCKGGTCQDESCLKCKHYISGSNPRVEAFR